MAFESFDAFLAMGRHGFYVWTAYALSLFLVVTNVVLAFRQQTKVKAQLARQLRREQLNAEEQP